MEAKTAPAGASTDAMIVCTVASAVQLPTTNRHSYAHASSGASTLTPDAIVR